MGGTVRGQDCRRHGKERERREDREGDGEMLWLARRGSEGEREGGGKDG